ncbi:MAG: hypothetical protein Q8P67_18325, partial [archaeon]|nr:hypothetical protein [archaeon]
IQPGLSPSEHIAALHDMLLRIRASLTSKPAPTNLPKRLQNAQQYSQDQLKIIDLFITLSRS